MRLRDPVARLLQLFAGVSEGRTLMKPERLPGLDALRALAIVRVILFHAGTLILGWPLGPVARFEWMGVDLFFVLSGLLIGAQWFEALLSRRAHFGPRSFDNPDEHRRLFGTRFRPL